ncbi:hypothetical protein KKH3_19200 [Pectobacterium actinidiae]|nr:hypothetical protein KKH3_19200 [Pectobacterium actinidiae]
MDFFARLDPIGQSPLITIVYSNRGGDNFGIDNIIKTISAAAE